MLLFNHIFPSLNRENESTTSHWLKVLFYVFSTQGYCKKKHWHKKSLATFQSACLQGKTRERTRERKNTGLSLSVTSFLLLLLFHRQTTGVIGGKRKTLEGIIYHTQFITFDIFSVVACRASHSIALCVLCYMVI